MKARKIFKRNLIELKPGDYIVCKTLKDPDEIYWGSAKYKIKSIKNGKLKTDECQNGDGCWHSVSFFKKVS